MNRPRHFRLRTILALSLAQFCVAGVALGQQTDPSPLDVSPVKIAGHYEIDWKITERGIRQLIIRDARAQGQRDNATPETIERIVRGPQVDAIVLRFLTATQEEYEGVSLDLFEDGLFVNSAEGLGQWAIHESGSMMVNIEDQKEDQKTAWRFDGRSIRFQVDADVIAYDLFFRKTGAPRDLP
ncbi:MAG: hypothetical protein OES25_03080 [Acidobacteriota bacterium]|nr:hypothetical protein [Acidobacteriota bacterium]